MRGARRCRPRRPAAGRAARMRSARQIVRSSRPSSRGVDGRRSAMVMPSDLRRRAGPRAGHDDRRRARSRRSVITNSVRPAAISALIPNSFDSENFERDQRRDRVAAGPRTWVSECGSNIGEMISVTAIVSPSARPRPSIDPPMMPPRPNGSTTVSITPHFVPPERERALLLAGRRLREDLAHHCGADRHDHRARRRAPAMNVEAG